MTYKILVIGSDGLLGNLLFEKLKTRYDVVGTTKNNQKRNKIKCDITKKEDIIKAVRKVKPNIIIHLAGITGNIECEINPKQTLETNVMGTYYILESIKNKKIKLIFASSREVYGNTKSKVNENSSLQPINMNGITKMFSEELIKQLSLKNKIQYNILRFTNFYGEHNERRGISKMIKNALEGKKISIFGGNQNIDLLHFEDAIDAIIKTIEYQKNGTFNIGCGRSLRLLAIIKIIEEISKNQIDYNLKKSRYVEAQKFSMDTSKAKRELGFEAKITPKIGIKRMITKWMKN